MSVIIHVLLFIVCIVTEDYYGITIDLLCACVYYDVMLYFVHDRLMYDIKLFGW